MLFFMNDYSEGAHPRVLEALVKTNEVKQVGYGLDDYCKEAINLIKSKVGDTDIDVHLLPAGTLTNLIAIASFLRPYEAVISTRLGHIAVHETGAIEATGHKVIEVDSNDGILRPEDIEKVVSEHVDEHMVLPRLVYISNATEMGTIYSKDMLVKIREKCDEHGLLLYLDGARLANALTCNDADLPLNDISELTDAFYIGGTKNGMLFGEALIISNEDLKKNIRFMIKQRGGLLAKGRLLGIQFIEMFKDDLYFDLARHTNAMAHKLKEGIKALDYELIVEPSTNLIFTKLPNHVHKVLSKECYYEAELPFDKDHMEARFVTSWATDETSIDVLLNRLKELK